MVASMIKLPFNNMFKEFISPEKDSLLENFNDGIYEFYDNYCLCGNVNNKNDIILYATGSRGARDPLALQEWFSIGAAFRNWYTGGTDGYSGTGVASDPSSHPQGAAIKRLGALADEAKTLAYGDRKANYIETQQIVIDNMFIVGLVGDTPAFNGVVVKKRNFLNVPANAPNQSALQNPGIGRTVQFFFDGGKNDSE